MISRRSVWATALAVIVTWAGAAGASVLSMYGDPSAPYGNPYGGANEFGTVSWVASPGSATFDVQLDSGLSIFAVSFNVTVPATDFVIDVVSLDTDWSYRGLSTTELIGTDKFDFTLFRSSTDGVGNFLSFTVTGASINDDSDFLRPNVLPGNSAWDAILRESRIAVYARRESDDTNMALSDIQHGATVPEPSVLALFGLGIVVLVASRRNRRESRGRC